MFKKICAIVTLLVSSSAYAADALCPDAELLSGKIISDICWDCVLPIKLAGATMGTGDVPPNAASGTFCACNDDLGIPQPGFMTSLWEPSKIIETVKHSGCSPALGGMRLPLSDVGRLGQVDRDDSAIDTDQVSFMHYHYFAFPVLAMTEAFIGGLCDNSGVPDFDLMYLSEIDPSYNNEELAFALYPEAAAFARIEALMACGADTVAASTTGFPLDSLGWCAWGPLYNMAGYVSGNESWPVTTNKIATRATAMLHRRGLARKTMGDDTICEASIWPTLPKSQYKYSYFYPVPEADDSHVISEHETFWGAGRRMFGPGENALLMQFRWNDCCMIF